MKNSMCRVSIKEIGGKGSVSIDLSDVKGARVREVVEGAMAQADIGPRVEVGITFLGFHTDFKMLPPTAVIATGRRWRAEETHATVADAVASIVCERRYSRTAIQMEQEANRGAA